MQAERKCKFNLQFPEAQPKLKIVQPTHERGRNSTRLNLFEQLPFPMAFSQGRRPKGSEAQPNLILL
jgi:hypothetical protein